MGSFCRFNGNARMPGLILLGMHWQTAAILRKMKTWEVNFPMVVCEWNISRETKDLSLCRNVQERIDTCAARLRTMGCWEFRVIRTCDRNETPGLLEGQVLLPPRKGTVCGTIRDTEAFLETYKDRILPYLILSRSCGEDRPLL